MALLFHCVMERKMQQEYNVNYSYKLLTAFGKAPEVVYGLLPPSGKVANTTGIA